MNEVHEGGCVCGALRYRTQGDPARVNVCHCSWCQRRTGSGYAVVCVFERPRLALSGQHRLYRHRSDESGRWLDQHFCPACGTNIGFTAEWVPGVFALEGGTFDAPAWLDPSRHSFRYIYLRSAQPWSHVPPGAERFDEHWRR